MACKDTLWHDVYPMYMGHVVATCNWCQKKFTFEGLANIPTICPNCGGTDNGPKNEINNPM